MTVVHVGIGGGVTSIMRALVRGLPEFPTRVVFFGPLTGPLDTPDLPADDLTWIGGSNIIGYLSGVARLAENLKRQKPEVVFLHGFIPAVFGTIPAALAGVRSIIVVDHGPQLTYRWPKRLLLRLVAPWITHVVSVSRSSADWFHAEYGFIPAKRQRVIENGIDLVPFTSITTRQPELPFTISMISRMDRPQKDPATLVRAAAMLRDRKVPIRVRLVGTGNLMDELEQLVMKLNLGSVVELVGYDPDVPKRLRETDLVVLSTHWEGLPLGLIEAMAAGLPIVASRVIGVEGVIEHNRTGLLVPERDPAALADAIGHLLGDPAQAQALGQAAQRESEKRFALNRMLGDYRTLLTELTNSGQS